MSTIFAQHLKWRNWKTNAKSSHSRYWRYNLFPQVLVTFSFYLACNSENEISKRSYFWKGNQINFFLKNRRRLNIRKWFLTISEGKFFTSSFPVKWKNPISVEFQGKISFLICLGTDYFQTSFSITFLWIFSNFLPTLYWLNLFNTN